jgi:hypothetical protein
MNIDNDADLMYEAYITQRLHQPRFDLSDGFTASLNKEVQQLKEEGRNIHQIIKRIQIEVMKLNSNKDKKEKAPEVKPIKSKVNVPPRPMETKVGSSPSTTNREA